jgi:hypothetical protein
LSPFSIYPLSRFPQGGKACSFPPGGRSGRGLRVKGKVGKGVVCISTLSQVRSPLWLNRSNFEYPEINVYFVALFIQYKKECMNKILRKLLVVMVIVLPVFAGTDCKKQAKCGCDGDMLFTLTREQARVYWTTGSSITLTPLNNPYSSYLFCNPGEMFSKLSDSKSGDILLVSGHAFWECNFLYQSSNYSYGSMYKVYQLQVTDVETDLYGK